MALPITAYITTAAGTPVNGAKIYTYEGGTLSPKAVFTTSALTVAHANPIIAANGKATYFLGSGSYRIRVTDASDVELPQFAVDKISAQNFATEAFVSPLDYGATADGENDAAALKEAMESGFIVDGGGLTYSVDGTVKPTSLKALRNIKLVQIGSRASSNATVLDLRGLSNFSVYNVDIDMGETVGTLYSDDGNNGLYCGGSTTGSGTGETTVYAENFWLSDIRVTGSGCGTGVHIRNAKNFVATRLMVYDRLAGSTPSDPTNDSQNGVQINNCTAFILSDSIVRNLKTRLGGVATLKWTRGFLFAEVSDCTITNCVGEECDQTFDFSGGVSDTSSTEYKGNRNFTLSACVSKKAGTWGFKFANTTHDGVITGCVASDPGASGFVVSTQNTAITLTNDAFRTQNLDFVGCRSIGPRGTSWATAMARGFAILGSPGHAYPRGIRFIDCNATDYQGTPTLVDGFFSDAPVVEYPAAGYNQATANVCINCSTNNATTPFNGIGAMSCTLTGNGTQSIPGSTWTSLNWNDELSDPCGLHSTSSNNNTAYIKTAGWYEVDSRVPFAANATGDRRLRITKNGNAMDRTTVIQAPGASISCSVSTRIRAYLAPGDYVAIEAYQDSGGSLNALLNEGYFSVGLCP